MASTETGRVPAGLRGRDRAAGHARRPSRSSCDVNGTYVVFRKLYQDAAAFRRYLATAAKSLYGSDERPRQDLVAAEDDGPLAQRLPSRPVAREGRSRDRRGPCSVATTSPMQATTKACGARSAHTCVAATRARRRLKRATAVRRHRLDPARCRVRPASAGGRARGRWRRSRPRSSCSSRPTSSGSSSSCRRNGWRAASSSGSIRASRTRSTASAAKARRCLVPGAKRPFLFDLPTFVRVKGGEYLFVPGLKALEGLIEQKF